MARATLTDDLWKRLEPLIPKSRKNRHVQFAGRKPSEARRVLNGILFVLRTGVPWRSLPATSDFPSGYTCRRRLQQWQRAGILATAVRDAAGRASEAAPDRLVSGLGR